jgi:hypothetical protein
MVILTKVYRSLEQSVIFSSREAIENDPDASFQQEQFSAITHLRATTHFPNLAASTSGVS